MKMDYYDEATFLKEEVEVPDEQYYVAEKLYESSEKLFQQQWYGKNYGPIMLSSDKKTLIFAINLGETRQDREIGTNLYKIKIEKI